MEAAVIGSILGLGQYFSSTNEKQNNQNLNVQSKRNKLKTVRFQTPTVHDTNGMQKSLTGKVISKDAFHHNNMIPFFGSTVKQNVQADANNSLLDNQVGAGSVDQAKTETMQMFNREQKNIGTPFGTPSFSDERETIINDVKGHVRNNELPFEQIRVGPGLDDGQTNAPSGGYHQEKTRDAALRRQKTIDELRPKNDPKMSYGGVIMNPTQHIKTYAKPGEQRHRHPDRFVVNEGGKYNLGPKAVDQTAQRVMPQIVERDVARPETTQEYFGGGKYVDAARSQNIPLQRESHKQQFGAVNMGPAIQTEGGNNGTYGREGQVALPNQRTQTGARASDQMGPLSQSEGGQVPLIQTDQAKFSRKEQFQGNARAFGNKGMNQPGKLPAKDPNDIARGTIREQTEDNDQVAPPKTDVTREMDQSQMLRHQTNPEKEKISKQRKPTPQGMKLASGKQSYHVQTRKVEGDYFSSRDFAPSTVHNAGPNVFSLGSTSIRPVQGQSIHLDRTHPAFLKPVSENPQMSSVRWGLGNQSRLSSD